MKGVFLDTVGLLALWSENDRWHPSALAAYGDFSSQATPVFTTTYVLLECGNAAARRPYRLAPDRLRVHLEDQACLIQPTESDWRSAWAAYRRGEADQAGIVDHVSFAVMRRLGLTHAFTNDRHFRAAGFTPLF